MVVEILLEILCFTRNKYRFYYKIFGKNKNCHLIFGHNIDQTIYYITLSTYLPFIYPIICQYVLYSTYIMLVYLRIGIGARSGSPSFSLRMYINDCRFRTSFICVNGTLAYIFSKGHLIKKKKKKE